MTENNTCTSSKCLIKFVCHPVYTPSCMQGIYVLWLFVNNEYSKYSSKQLTDELRTAESDAYMLIFFMFNFNSND